MKNKYHRYSFYGLEVELRQIKKELPKTKGPSKKELLKNKEAIEKEISIRKDPYYSPWK